ncbi:ATP-binding protein [Actinoplanes sp. TFC3]|uniref:PAS domain-containing sensor histidine kinase n=1 Tax=Actinoplanes sp. TFC3 TaxID=1710355 RepID=UPI000AD503BC|nr:ATP-binding protein [Actinoplanes sp. TFC3]
MPAIVSVDPEVLARADRLEAVEAARHLLPALPLPMDGLTRLAARLLDAPMAMITLLGRDAEQLLGRFGLPPELPEQQDLTLDYSLCKFVVSANRPISVADLRSSDDVQLCEHLLVRAYDITAFLSVPLRDGNGRPLGSVTVLDTKPREWTERDTEVLTEIEQMLRPPGQSPPPPAVIAGLDSNALLDSVQQPLIAMDTRGTIVAFNKAAHDLLGYHKSEAGGRSFDSVVHPGYDNEPGDGLIAHLFTGAPGGHPVRLVSLRHRDGRRIPVEASMTVVHGSAGPLACVFIADSTKQLAAEEDAERSASFLKALLDSLSVGVVACDAAGRIILMNRALREVHELPDDSRALTEYIGQLEGVLFDEDERLLPLADMPLMRACAGEDIDGVTVHINLRDRQKRVFSITARPILAADGRRRGAVAVTHEITAVRRVEHFRECHASVEKILRTAVSMAEAAGPVLRSVGTTLGWSAAELFIVNEAGELRSAGHWHAEGGNPDQLFDHVPVKGLGATGRVWQNGSSVWIPEVEETAARGEPFERMRAEICLRHGIKTVLAVPLQDGGEILGVLTCYAGVVEHHEDLLTVLLDGVAAQLGAFAALRRGESLARQLARMQDDFISLVGHELRTPLASIAAHAGLLAEEGVDQSDDWQLMIGAIERNAGELHHIVATLLDLAGLDSGHLPLTVDTVDLGALVRRVVADARHGAADRGIRLAITVTEPVLVDGDEQRLGQVVGNLLANAIIYSRAGGTVLIVLTTGEGIAELCITDEGIGTPAQERDRVFDRFYRGSNVRHQGTEGSGLGLSVARTIMQLHGGVIILRDNKPVGTTVVLRLPQLHDVSYATQRL